MWRQILAAVTGKKEFLGMFSSINRSLLPQLIYYPWHMESPWDGQRRIQYSSSPTEAPLASCLRIRFRGLHRYCVLAVRMIDFFELKCEKTKPNLAVILQDSRAPLFTGALLTSWGGRL